jgi:hypothetical protein
MYVLNENFRVGIDGGDFYFIWSVYFKIINDIVKTENSFEGWHGFRMMFASNKTPSIVKNAYENDMRNSLLELVGSELIFRNACARD